jgi:hypothetical protein
VSSHAGAVNSTTRRGVAGDQHIERFAGVSQFLHGGGESRELQCRWLPTSLLTEVRLERC